MKEPSPSIARSAIPLSTRALPASAATPVNTATASTGKETSMSSPADRPALLLWPPESAAVPFPSGGKTGRSTSALTVSAARRVPFPCPKPPAQCQVLSGPSPPKNRCV
ncbi:hypothetical protein NXX51_13890 [Bacteroides thetaiotaomicron]|uniref:hypothetical protein n=1 Tax=Bacteroides thetaiotaomicron TaxID=818 RepID=UPI0021649C35|nr:hypothetical protein [Bacteroides thetaiotaomicron]UVS11066.1 hypothetical protein NXX51_13890 [Bacteroides thetaiotaomicron]